MFVLPLEGDRKPVELTEAPARLAYWGANREVYYNTFDSSVMAVDVSTTSHVAGRSAQAAVPIERNARDGSAWRWHRQP